MSRPGTIGWFAVHEARLAWRDWLSLFIGRRRRRAVGLALGVVIVALLLHGLAYLMLASSANLAGDADKRVLLVVTGALLMSWSMMISQALESATRAFYARGDLDLILTSPVSAGRLFAVRVAAMVMPIMLMTVLLAAPFIHVLAWYGGARWLGAYAVALALAMDAVAVAMLLTVAMFRAIGPARTRSIAQIVAAVIGAAFAIGMQFAAIVSYGGLSRMTFARLPMFVELAPDRGSVIWWPARALLGEPTALAVLMGLSIAAFAATIYFFAPRFGQLALAAGTASHRTMPRRRRRTGFHDWSPAQALRRKEWMLLVRDPWLMSQTLMQLLYLLPAAFLLWRNFYTGAGTSALLVPILVVAGGQLAGGLAWLAVSGEDAPELIATAPVPASRVLRAKAEAVLGAIAVVFSPLIVMLALAAPFAGLVALVGIFIAAGSATAIQFWFRTQAKRTLFRRRQTSSRVANIAEALSSIGWAGTSALAATGTWLAIIPGILVLMIVAGVWLISPVRNPAAT